MDPTITELVDYIWAQKESNLTLRKICKTKEYESCCNKFGPWKFLIDEAIKDMLVDLKSFESHDYVISENKIAYKEQDGISYDIVYGYKTLFTYYREYDKGNISKSSLKENIFIGVRCGNYSYAELLHRFRNILGVTGTLETLNTQERNIIRGYYKILINTYVPSAYGKNNRRFRERADVFIEDKENYFLRIINQIGARSESENEETRSPVLVFF